MRIPAALLLAPLALALAACGGGNPTAQPDPATATPAPTISPQLRDWVDSFLATTDYVPESVAEGIRGSDSLVVAAVACKVVYTADPALQEQRVQAWKRGMGLVWADDNDVTAAAAHAAIQSPEVCFEDPAVREMAFGDVGYLTTPPEGFAASTPTPPPPTPTGPIAALEAGIEESRTALDELDRECWIPEEASEQVETVLYDTLDTVRALRERLQDGEVPYNGREHLDGLEAAAAGYQAAVEMVREHCQEPPPDDAGAAADPPPTLPPAPAPTAPPVPTLFRRAHPHARPRWTPPARWRGGARRAAEARVPLPEHARAVRVRHRGGVQRGVQVGGVQRGDGRGGGCLQRAVALVGQGRRLLRVGVTVLRHHRLWGKEGWNHTGTSSWWA